MATPFAVGCSGYSAQRHDSQSQTAWDYENSQHKYDDYVKQRRHRHLAPKIFEGSGAAGHYCGEPPSERTDGDTFWADCHNKLWTAYERGLRKNYSLADWSLVASICSQQDCTDPYTYEEVVLYCHRLGADERYNNQRAEQVNSEARRAAAEQRMVEIEEERRRRAKEERSRYWQCHVFVAWQQGGAFSACMQLPEKDQRCHGFARYDDERPYYECMMTGGSF